MDKYEIYEQIGLLYDQSLLEDSRSGGINNYRWEIGLNVFGILYSDCLKIGQHISEQTNLEVKGELWGYPVEVNPKAPNDTLKLWKEVK